MWILSLALAVAFVGCDDDDDNRAKVPSAVKNAFNQMFPGATNVGWSNRNHYSIADFKHDGKDSEAWFDREGVWYMTETDITYAELPEQVRSAFEAGDYASWHVDDVEKIERRQSETLYALDVESGAEEYELFYTADGVLVRAVPDKDNDDRHDGWLPQNLPQAITDFLGMKYPNARIVDVESERGMIEVEIIDGRTLRDVFFSAADNAWVGTETEITVGEVPAAVMQTLQASEYGAWDIDDVDHWDTHDRGEWYRFSMEDPNSDREVEVDILADGTMLS